MRILQKVYKVLILVSCVLLTAGWIPAQTYATDGDGNTFPIRRVTKAKKVIPHTLSGRSSSLGILTPLTVLATAYCLSGTMRDGKQVHSGAIAVDPRVIPLGSKVYIPGLGIFTAEDTGSSIIGNHIDIWMPSYGSAMAWGRRVIQIFLIKEAS